MKPTVVILAGGIGKRFKPFQTSKPLFHILDASLIETTVRKAKKSGFKKFVIVTNPHDQPSIDDLFKQDPEITTVIQENPLGMGNALLSVKKECKGSSILVINATDQVEQSLYNQISKAVSKNEPFVVGKKMTSYFNGGYLVVKNKKAISVIEKPGEGKEPSNLVNLVFHFFPKADEFIGRIEKVSGRADDHYEQALTSFMSDTPFGVLEYDGYWQATKYPWDILPMTMLLLEKELSPDRKSKSIAPSAIIDKNVFIGKGVVVHENAVIKGPSYIGDNAVIGNNSFIRSSYIGENAVIGTNSEVARSYIGEHCWLHQNYIGDSVLESNVAFGAGSVTANFRLDEKNVTFMIDHKRFDTKLTHLGAVVAADVRIGVNCSLMPGVKIGHNSIIGPHSLIDENIDRFTRVISQVTTKKAPFKGIIAKRK